MSARALITAVAWQLAELAAESSGKEVLREGLAKVRLSEHRSAVAQQ